MNCNEIIGKLESLSPTAFAEDWDNIGLLVGRRDKEVETIYIALDATDEVIEEAVRVGADMLLTHHLFEVDRTQAAGKRRFFFQF